MLNRLVIIGAGGHGKVISDIALKNGYKNIVFIDDKATENCLGFPIIGETNALESLNDEKTDFIIAVGDNENRKRIASKYRVNWVNLIHPSAQVGFAVKIGYGTVIMANAVINSGTTLGNHCIINSSAVVEHDNIVEDYVHISPNVSLGGTVHIGEETHIGIGATVINNVTIGSKIVVGAGAVVVDNILNSGLYLGVPAKRFERGTKE